MTPGFDASMRGMRGGRVRRTPWRWWLTRFRIIFFMLKRGEPYRGVNRGLWKRKFKRMKGKALSGLRN